MVAGVSDRWPALHRAALLGASYRSCTFESVQQQSSTCFVWSVFNLLNETFLRFEVKKTLTEWRNAFFPDLEWKGNFNTEEKCPKIPGQYNTLVAHQRKLTGFDSYTSDYLYTLSRQPSPQPKEGGYSNLLLQAVLLNNNVPFIKLSNYSEHHFDNGKNYSVFLVERTRPPAPPPTPGGGEGLDGGGEGLDGGGDSGEAPTPPLPPPPTPPPMAPPLPRTVQELQRTVFGRKVLLGIPVVYLGSLIVYQVPGSEMAHAVALLKCQGKEGESEALYIFDSDRPNEHKLGKKNSYVKFDEWRNYGRVLYSMTDVWVPESKMAHGEGFDKIRTPASLEE